jgi:hypothetical protein
MTSAIAQVSIGIGFPGVSIGINLPLYPELVRVPDYPVYYAPRLNANYFFYDGMYWVYEGDTWYASTWYNGPWGLVDPDVVPLFVLRIPVRYYRAPPGYFRGWQADAPPRWGEYWGNSWQQRRGGWDRWNRSAAPAPALLPVYQRQYAGDRYPRLEQQRAIQTQNYRHQPSEAVVRQHYQQQAVQPAQKGAPQDRNPGAQDNPRANQPAPPPGAAAGQRSQPAQKGGEDAQRSVPAQAPSQQKGMPSEDQRQQSQQRIDPREQQAPRSSQDSPPPGKGAAQEERRGQGQQGQQGQDKAQDKGRDKGDERNQERNK